MSLSQSVRVDYVVDGVGLNVVTVFLNGHKFFARHSDIGEAIKAAQDVALHIGVPTIEFGSVRIRVPGQEV